jgi:hypothetical protein
LSYTVTVLSSTLELGVSAQVLESSKSLSLSSTLTAEGNGI